MRLLNVEALICDRCAAHFVMRQDDPHQHDGYGTVTVRAINAKPIVARRGQHMSPQEMRVLQGMAEGKANKLIARDLGIMDATVKVHVKAILRKTGTANRTQAAAMVFRNGNGENRPDRNPEPEPQQITTCVEKTVDLCPKCLVLLEQFLCNGGPTLVDLADQQRSKLLCPPPST